MWVGRKGLSFEQIQCCFSAAAAVSLLLSRRMSIARRVQVCSEKEREEKKETDACTHLHTYKQHINPLLLQQQRLQQQQLQHLQQQLSLCCTAACIWRSSFLSLSLFCSAKGDDKQTTATQTRRGDRDRTETDRQSKGDRQTQGDRQ